MEIRGKVHASPQSHREEATCADNAVTYIPKLLLTSGIFSMSARKNATRRYSFAHAWKTGSMTSHESVPPVKGGRRERQLI